MMQHTQSIKSIIENIPQLIGTAYSLANPFDNTLDIVKLNPPSIMEDLKKIINANEYVNECVSNKKKDYNSLSYLIDRDLSQSDCIKLGNGSEKVFIDIILKNNLNLENIKPKNKKGKKEKDHLFMDSRTNTIYYAEIKSNLNLDTEKCKSTRDKCMQVFDELKNEFPDYTIKMFLVGIRYYKKSVIPKVISDKYLCIDANVMGVNDYLTEMNTNIHFDTEEIYKEFLNYLADKMFNE
jgi:hypothetical protein